jgi:hypothetical protein
VRTSPELRRTCRRDSSMAAMLARDHKFRIANTGNGRGDLTPPGSIFCTLADGTGHNAPFEIPDPQDPTKRKRIPGVFGKALHDPCLQKMRIKDQK